MTERWYESAFGQTYYETYKAEFSPAQTAEEVDGLIRLLNLTPGARILDLCCGFGRHSLALARRGYAVTGLDNSVYLLDIARQAAREHSLEIDWVQADMRAIPAPAQPYDAVINLFSAFGYLENDDEEAKVARAIFQVLAPGGGLLIDTVNREIVLRQWTPLRWQENPDTGAILAERLHFDMCTGRIHVREVAVHPDGRRTEEEHSLRLWAYTELVSLFAAAGFVDTHPHGEFNGSAYTWDSYRMIVTTRKP